jgi:hypothetical protein
MHRWLLLWITAAAFSAEIPGEFQLFPGSFSGTVTLQLTRTDTPVDNSRVLRVELAQLDGLRADPFAQRGLLRFRLIREAGFFYFEGKPHDSSIRGTFRFVESAAFANRLKGTISNWYEPGVLFDYAVQNRTITNRPIQDHAAQDRSRIPADASATLPVVPAVEPRFLPGERERYLRALRESGYPLLKPDLDRLRIHNVQPDLLRQMKLSGYDALSTNDMVKLQTHGITSADVLTFQVRGLNNLTADEMVKLKISGIPDTTSQPRP